jgi:hypothetical protein
MRSVGTVRGCRRGTAGSRAHAAAPPHLDPLPGGERKMSGTLTPRPCRCG